MLAQSFPVYLHQILCGTLLLCWCSFQIDPFKMISGNKVHTDELKTKMRQTLGMCTDFTELFACCANLYGRNKLGTYSV